jgi:hypothetical protein
MEVTLLFLASAVAFTEKSVSKQRVIDSQILGVELEQAFGKEVGRKPLIVGLLQGQQVGPGNAGVCGYILKGPIVFEPGLSQQVANAIGGRGWLMVHIDGVWPQQVRTVAGGKFLRRDS